MKHRLNRGEKQANMARDIILATLMLLASLILLFQCGQKLRAALRIASLQTTEGKIISAGVWGGNAFMAKVEYEFQVNGTTYVESLSEFSLDEAVAQKLVARYPLGKPVTVYYLPEKPNHCSLDPYRNLNIPANIIGSIFSVFLVPIAVRMIIAQLHLRKSVQLAAMDVPYADTHS